MVGLDENGRFNPINDTDMDVVLKHVMMRCVNDERRWEMVMPPNTTNLQGFCDEKYSRLDHSKICLWFTV